MSHETFDPITRNIRAIEIESRQAISEAETAIAAMRRKRTANRFVTVAAYQAVFDKLGACLADTNQAHDSVVAHAHLVADNISARSKKNVLAIRQSIVETANELLNMTAFNRTALPQGVYDPGQAIDMITAALFKAGLITENPSMETFAISRTQVGYIASFALEQYVISIVVTISATSEGKNLGEGSDEIVVSVWEDRIPPLWDTSYHAAAGVPINAGNPKGKNLGKWTKQTDNALFAYVANVLSKDVRIPSSNTVSVPRTPMEHTNRYGTYIGRQGKAGSEKFDDLSVATILGTSISATTTGEQGEYVINLNPQTVNKITLATFIMDTIQQFTKERLGGRVRMHREGYYQIMYDSASKVSNVINGILDGKA